MTLPVVSITTGRITWTDPPLNTDGSAVSAGEITGFNVGFRAVNAAGSTPGQYPITAGEAPSSTSAPLSGVQGLIPGTEYAAAVQAATANGVSAWSTPEFLFITAMPIPNPPTAVSVA